MEDDVLIREDSPTSSLFDAEKDQYEAENEDRNSAVQGSRRYRHSARNREFVSTSMQSRLRDWCDDNASVKSGSLNEAHLHYSTFSRAYEAYKKNQSQNHYRPYSFSGFCSVLYKWTISPMRYNAYACPLCYNLYFSHKSISDIENDPHTIQNNHIWPIYTSQIDVLKAGSSDYVLVIMDYCRVHEL
jgi:hypothetical protein